MSASTFALSWRSHIRSWIGAFAFGLLGYSCITSFAHFQDDYLLRVNVAVLAAVAALMFLSSSLGVARWQVDSRRWWLFGAALGSILLSAMLAPQWPAAWSRLLLYYGVALFGLAIYQFHRDDKGLCIAPYLLAIAIVHAAVLVEVVFWMLMVNGGEHSMATRMPYHGNVRHFGYLGYLAAAASAGLWAVVRRWSLVPFLLCTAALFGIVALGSRGALLGWSAFIVAFVWLSPMRWRTASMCVFATGLAVAVVWWLTEYHQLMPGSLITRAEAGESFRTYDRLALWGDVLRAISRQPWFGYGPEGQLVSACCPGRGLYIAGAVQPHNLVLQLLLEFGVVGTVLIGSLVAVVWRGQIGGAGWRAHVRSRLDLQVLVAILIGFLVFGLVDGLLFYPVPLIHFAALAGLLLVLARRPPHIA